MDCCSFNRDENLTTEKEHPNIYSPEMFDSENEDAKINDKDSLTNETAIQVTPEIPSQVDLVAKSDNNLLIKINKLLSGVPPPPKLTICRTDCTELLLRIYENQHLFWIPNVLSQKQLQEDVKNTSTLRNLSTAINVCDSQCQSDVSNNITTVCLKSNNYTDNCRLEQIVSNKENSINNSEKNVIKPLKSERIQKTSNNDDIKISSAPVKKQSLLYYTTNEKQASILSWPEAYSNTFHGIHYNRSTAVEEFENLTPKLCDRYIGAETQSTCTVWFSKQTPGSAKKRNLLAKRDNGQSPGKRLNHLTKRRKTFSSANLQGLALNNKKLVVLNIKKPTIKRGKSPRGKSPRGKSPRGKSPRKTPRSSAKKRAVRRLVLDGSSPLKSKIETSKRALFQSPPPDRAGPSKTLIRGSNSQSIKRALFTQSTKENDLEGTQKITEESRKRKNEEELEGPRFKWAKSLSFDCAHELHNNTAPSWERYSSSNIIEKNKSSVTERRNELSDTHRKKLLWAVAEALRCRGIGMTHPQFKQYATNLARTIKKLMPELENKNIPRKPGSTTDRMLELAKDHVLFVIDSRPTD